MNWDRSARLARQSDPRQARAVAAPAAGVLSRRSWSSWCSACASPGRDTSSTCSPDRRCGRLAAGPPGRHPGHHGRGAGQRLGRGARASGILDFHRVSPLTPTELTLGFFFGAPIREYLLFAATLPFSVALHGLRRPEPPRVDPAHDPAWSRRAWTFHGLALLNGLISKSKNPTGERDRRDRASCSSSSARSCMGGDGSPSISPRATSG